MQENYHSLDFELDEATVTELDELINEKQIQGDRYTEALMVSIDSEKDRSID